MINREKISDLVGQVILGQYHLESVIGEGGFGAVFRARELSTNNYYAIKMLYPNDQVSLAQRRKELQYFQREVGTLSRVRHENIVAIYQGGLTEAGLPYLILELAEGQILNNVLRKEGYLSLLRATRILSQLCSAATAMHQQGIIHRDLKPENIMVLGEDPNEVVKLLDFGLARLAHGEGDKWLRTITGRGQVHGTIYYMSPEQCEGKKLDERTDIYSLGVIAYELLCGKAPFRAASPLGVMMAHLEALPPPLRAQRPDLPVEVEIAILKALEKNRDNRYSSAMEFAHRLEKIAADTLVAQLKAGGSPNAQIESAARTEVIPIDNNRLTTEMDSASDYPVEETNSQPQISSTSRLSKLVDDIFNKLKGE